jgi:hypothetical protein
LLSFVTFVVGLFRALGFSSPLEVELVHLHIHAPSAKAHAFCFQPQPLLDCRVATQLNFPASAKNSLPGQTEGTMQHSRNLASVPR